MDKIDKFTGALSKEVRKIVENLLQRVKKGDFLNLDIKKLKGGKNIFRLRKGKIRIIYKTTEKGETNLLFVGRRTDKIYKKLGGL